MVYFSHHFFLDRQKKTLDHTYAPSLSLRVRMTKTVYGRRPTSVIVSESMICTWQGTERRVEGGDLPAARAGLSLPPSDSTSDV